jgi:hypothetical protein
MQEVLEADELMVRPDRQVGVSTESGSFFARVLDEKDDPHIEVYSVILTEIDNDPGLLEKLNELNRGLCHSRVLWAHRYVVVAGELLGETAEVRALELLCKEVTRVVDGCAEEIKAVFGGLLENEREDDE